MQTQVSWGSPLAVKQWGNALAVQQFTKSYWEQRFIGTDQNRIIQRKTELESNQGDTVTFDLSVQLRGDATYGDNRLEGKEEQLRFHTDELKIDQVRKAVSAGGQMTRKRTEHDLRQVARDRSSDYWAQFFDEVLFVYLSGNRGVNKDYALPKDWAGMALNPLQAPDDTHLIFGGQATSKATLTADDKMSRVLVEKASTICTMLRADDPDASNMVPVMVDGTSAYVLLMSPYQAYDLRVEQGTQGWLEVQKALATNLGNKSPIVKGGLGQIGDTIMHSHAKVVRMEDYGAGNNVKAARALFMGAQAGIIGYGMKNGSSRFSWKEKLKDYENEPTVASGTIVGVKKSRFNGKDFGVISLDTAASPPSINGQ